MLSRSPSSFDGTTWARTGRGRTIRRFPCRRRRRWSRRQRGAPRDGWRLRRSGSRPNPGGRGGPLCRTGSGGGRHRHQSSPTRSRSRFRRRRRRAPASPTSSLATRRTRWISGSSIWPAPIPFSSPAGEARTSRRTTRGMSPVWRATTRENGRSSSSGRFAQARAPRSCPESFCRSPSRSGTGSRASVATGEVSRPGTPSTSSREVVPSAVGPMVRTALIILVIELAVIFWVRRRYGYGARGELGSEPSHPAATEGDELFGHIRRGSNVQEHLRSRR